MFTHRLSKLPLLQPKLCVPIGITTRSKKKRPLRPSACSLYKQKKSGGASASEFKLERALRTGKCRMGFIPEEWFTFFSTKTGVSGPYFLMLGIVNYLCSKEIFVMEHEYYSGLSIVLLLYLVTTRFGDKIGESLDKQVDEVHATFQKGRDDDINMNTKIIKEAELAQAQAKGQELLVAAKKENIALQLEAAYRERLMTVYKAVRGRMEYHIRMNRAEKLIVQRWMIEWILKQVNASLTPEFRKKALESAMIELEETAKRLPKMEP